MAWRLYPNGVLRRRREKTIFLLQPEVKASVAFFFVLNMGLRRKNSKENLLDAISKRVEMNWKHTIQFINTPDVYLVEYNQYAHLFTWWQQILTVEKNRSKWLWRLYEQNHP